MTSLENLAQKLLNIKYEDNERELHILLSQLVEALKSPGDIGCLIGPVVKLLPSRNIQVKKTSYSVLPRICQQHSEVSLLAANTLIQDSQDPNPLIKSIAICALGNLPTLHQEYAPRILHTSLNDDNPKVRKAAVNCCKKIFDNYPKILHEEGLIDRLYMCIRDPDPGIVTSCMLVLDTVLAGEGGIVVNRNMSLYLLHRLNDFSAQHLATVIQVLKKYKPKEEDELFQELSILDQYLVHPTSSAIVINCVSLFLLFTEEKYPHLEKDIRKRVLPVLKNHLATKSSRDSSLYIINFLLTMTNKDNDWFSAFEDSPQLFYPKIDGCDFELSEKKLQLLPFICTKTNVTNVLEVLKNNFSQHSELHANAFNCIFRISVRIPAVSEQCLNIIISALDSTDGRIHESALDMLKNFNFKNFDNNSIDTLLKKLIRIIDMTSNRIPLILPILIGDFGENNEETPYILESISYNFNIYENEDFKNLVLFAALKMFMKEPGVYQHILGRIMEMSLKSENDSILKSKAMKYYVLLKENFTLAQKMLL